MSVFHRFAPRLQEAIVARLGWASLRPVQEEAGEALLAGDNAVILAPTAGGKTEAAMFPVLSGLVNDPPRGVGALYIAPIKALLNNQATRLGLYTEMVGLERFVWHGDVGPAARRRFQREPSELLMTTPESLEVMLMSPRFDAGALFGDLRVVVIDEVHALAGTDRGAHLASVLERVAALGGRDVQRVGLSATVGNPEAIVGWLAGSSRREGRVVNPPTVRGGRELLVAHRPGDDEIGRAVAQLARHGKSLVFCQSRATSERVAEHLGRSGVDVFVHHSAVSKEERELAEERFHGGPDRQGASIVCTSTLELGIDVGDLDRVFQIEAPDTVGSFLQRMGRTGRRAGQTPNMTFLCETSDGVLLASALIELARSGWVEDVEVNPRCWPALVHQLLAMSLASGGVTLEAAWEVLSRVPDFRGIGREEVEALVAHMVATEAFVIASGRLVLGPQAERRFGRRNFMELYAVFSTPTSYQVVTVDGQPIGTLGQAFVDRLVDEISSFLLGGRAWLVAGIDHKVKQVRVTAAPRGRSPSWGGMVPQFLGLEVCQRIGASLREDAVPAYLDARGRELLAERRAAVAGVLTGGRRDLEDRGESVVWWTFAGGRINTTYKHALVALGLPWRVVVDNLWIEIRGGDDLSVGALGGWLDRLADDATWDDERLWAEIVAGLPDYRLSKFQALMPPWAAQELVAKTLLDVDGARRLIG
ncbi:MAG: DEAD/DEAH box helicase [Deltaproteobacteria bacterium HGW-Deltaproteobacteria-14]|nr:MAG: DEAD/DEAH box helicase [Deltaproteobacteria bacterium HGW-Deltaproteobacteria-14]